MGGPRRCLGDKFSLLEQRTLLLKLLTQYEVLPHKDMAKQEDNFCTSPMSLMLLQPKDPATNCFLAEVVSPIPEDPEGQQGPRRDGRSHSPPEIIPEEPVAEASKVIPPVQGYSLATDILNK
eukprot:g14779.t1